MLLAIMHDLAPQPPPSSSTSAPSASLSRPPFRRFPSIARSSTLKRAKTHTPKSDGPPSKLRQDLTLSRRPSTKASRSGARREGELGGQEESMEGMVDEMDVMDLVESLEGQEELEGWREAVGKELKSANEKLLEYTEKEYGRRVASPRDLIDELVKEGAIAELSRFVELLADKGVAEDQLKKATRSAAVYDAMFKILVEQGQLTVDSLSLFRTLPLNKLKLDFQHSPESDDAEVVKTDALLSTFAAPNSFCTLTRLDLSSIPIPQHSLHFLSNLSLLKLKLDATETTIEGVACLVPLAPTLRALHLADNSTIDDDCLPLLSLFSMLVSLDLTGTSTTQAGLRSFVVKARQAQPKLLQVAPPATVQDYVTSLLIPAPVFDSRITEASQVFELSSADLLNNYKGWKVKGYIKTHKGRQVKMEVFLRSREDDVRCKELMSEEKVAIARVWEE